LRVSIVGHEHMRSPLFVALALVGFAACSGTGEPAGPGPAKIVELDAGNFHTCVRLDDGTVECWGQCGPQCGVRPDGSTGRLPVAGLVGAVELAVGDSHGCARLPDGDVTCWGSNYSGGGGRRAPARARPARAREIRDADARAGRARCHGDRDRR
jgi:alpha-tubulin suppressor-like RCC1 family protein